MASLKYGFKKEFKAWGKSIKRAAVVLTSPRKPKKQWKKK
jgi:hypothetical protein